MNPIALVNISNVSQPSTFVDSLDKLSDQITYYFVIFSSSIGIPCNLLSLLVFHRLMHKVPNNMGFLGMCQSLIDLTLLLSFLFLIHSSPLIFPTSLANSSTIACRLLTYLRRLLIHASSSIPVLITFDRFTFVLYGHNTRFKFLKNKLHLVEIMILMMMAIAIVNIPNLLFYPRNSSCDAYFNIIIVTDLVSIALRTYIPFTFLVVLNILMLRKILTVWKINRHNLLKCKHFQFTISVVFYDVFFFVINFPVSIYYVLKDVYLSSILQDPLVAAQFKFANSIVVNLSYYEQTFTFFIYLAFNKLYRRELCRIRRKIWSNFRTLFGNRSN